MAVSGIIKCTGFASFTPPIASTATCGVTILSISPSGCLTGLGGGSSNSVHSIIVQVDLIQTSGTVNITVDGNTQTFSSVNGTNSFEITGISCTTSGRVLDVLVADNADPSCNATQSYVAPAVPGSSNWNLITSSASGTLLDCTLVTNAPINTGSTTHTIQITFTNGVPSLQFGITNTGLQTFRYISGSTTLYCEVNVTALGASSLSLSINLSSSSGASTIDIVLVDNSLATTTNC